MTQDLREAAGACIVPWAVLEARGPEACSYLQGQLSQDVAALAEGATTWSFLLAPSGKVDAWLRVTRTGPDEYLLDAPEADAGAVVARLERFRLRTAVEIAALDRTVVAMRGPGSEDAAAELASGGDPRLALPAGWPGVEGADVVVTGPPPERPAGIPRVERAAWDALRVECGVPLNGRDIGADTIPAEAGGWMIDASVSFTKGCFTGQELVARIDSRGGNVPRPLRGVVARGGQIGEGDEIVVDGRPVGRLTSVATSPALGPVGLGRVARSVERGAEVLVRSEHGTAAGTLHVLPLR